MFSLRILAAGFLLTITGCQERKAAQVATKLGSQAVAPKLVMDTSRVAVLPYDKKQNAYIFQVYDEKLGESIPQVVKPASLSSAELAQVKVLLRACIDEYNQAQVIELQKLRKAQPNEVFKADNFIINLPKYKRQLVAVINTKGEKEVWVNCFSHELYKMDWHHEIAFWHDGGNCLFNVRINLTKRKWCDLMVNGSA